MLQLVLLSMLDTQAQEYRLGISYTGQILPKVEVDGKLQLRKLSDYSNGYYSIAQAGVQYEFVENISISGSFRGPFFCKTHIHQDVR